MCMKLAYQQFEVTLSDKLYNDFAHTFIGIYKFRSYHPYKNFASYINEEFLDTNEMKTQGYGNITEHTYDRAEFELSPPKRKACTLLGITTQPKYF